MLIVVCCVCLFLGFVNWWLLSVVCYRCFLLLVVRCALFVVGCVLFVVCCLHVVGVWVF